MVQPMSNLIATDQVRGGDWIRVDFDETTNRLTFFKEAEGLPTQVMAEMMDHSLVNLQSALTQAAVADTPKATFARGTRRSESTDAKGHFG